jgi:hypothetical protein
MVAVAREPWEASAEAKNCFLFAALRHRLWRLLCLDGKLKQKWVSSYMPTGLWINAWRVFINSNDHKPAHVHVEAGGNEAVFLLYCPTGPVAVRDNWGFPQHELNDIERELNDQSVLAKCCAKWRAIHGSYI